MGEIQNAEERTGLHTAAEKAPEKVTSVDQEFESFGQAAPSARHDARYLFSCFFGITVIILVGWILNAFIFPYYDTLLSFTREISTFANAITLIAIALTATWRPRVLHERSLALGSVVFLLLGPILIYVGLAAESVVALVIGASFAAIGRGVFSMLIGLSCLALSVRNVGLCVAGGILCSYLIRGVLAFLPPSISVVIFIVAPLLSLALAAAPAKKLLQQIRSEEPPAQLAITQPSSFLPYGHQLFICLLLFRIAYGFAMTLDEVDGAPLFTPYALIPVIIVAALIFARSKPLNPDTLFRASFLLVIAGFLLLAVPFTEKHAVVNTLLMGGVGCFDILFWFVLISLGAKNPSGSLQVFAWGLAVNSFGVIIGANLGRFANGYYGTDSPTVALLAVVSAFLFIFYAVVILRKFSFEETIAGVHSEQAPVSHIEASLLDERCEEISEEYRLTAREKEVFNLLARGRNGRFIQDELVVSYNTVKAHVKHIYAKLDIHTQQELIDMVESE